MAADQQGTTYTFTRTEFGRRHVERMRATLQQQEIDYAAGDKESLAVAIALCAELSMPLPAWAAAAWCKALKDYIEGRIKSFDDALVNGRRPKTAKRRRKEHSDRVAKIMLKDVLPYVKAVPIRREGDRHDAQERDRLDYVARHLMVTRRRARKLYSDLPTTERPPRLPKKRRTKKSRQIISKNRSKIGP